MLASASRLRAIAIWHRPSQPGTVQACVSSSRATGDTPKPSASLALAPDTVSRYAGLTANGHQEFPE
jgi:hypothetical protein